MIEVHAAMLRVLGAAASCSIFFTMLLGHALAIWQAMY
jgi:hypothetical protein